MTLETGWKCFANLVQTSAKALLGSALLPKCTAPLSNTYLQLLWRSRTTPSPAFLAFSTHWDRRASSLVSSGPNKLRCILSQRKPIRIHLCPLLARYWKLFIPVLGDIGYSPNVGCQ